MNVDIFARVFLQTCTEMADIKPGVGSYLALEIIKERQILFRNASDENALNSPLLRSQQLVAKEFGLRFIGLYNSRVVSASDAQSGVVL